MCNRDGSTDTFCGAKCVSRTVPMTYHALAIHAQARLQAESVDLMEFGRAADEPQVATDSLYYSAEILVEY